MRINSWRDVSSAREVRNSRGETRAIGARINHTFPVEDQYYNGAKTFVCRAVDGEDLDNFVGDDRVNAPIEGITVATMGCDHILFVKNELGAGDVRHLLLCWFMTETYQNFNKRIVI